jgi:hypothetical protein
LNEVGGLDFNFTCDNALDFGFHDNAVILKYKVPKKNKLLVPKKGKLQTRTKKEDYSPYLGP